MTPLPFTSEYLLSQSNKMCEKRIRRIKKGSHSTRLRESRRLQRIQWLTSPPVVDEIRTSQIIPLFVDKNLQKRVFLELAWKTVALMQKNRLIQEKIVALQKETSEFVTSILNNPENRKRYLDHLKLYGTPALPTVNQGHKQHENNIIKVEPKKYDRNGNNFKNVSSYLVKENVSK